MGGVELEMLVGSGATNNTDDEETWENLKVKKIKSKSDFDFSKDGWGHLALHRCARLPTVDGLSHNMNSSKVFSRL